MEKFNSSRTITILFPKLENKNKTNTNISLKNYILEFIVPVELKLKIKLKFLKNYIDDARDDILQQLDQNNLVEMLDQHRLTLLTGNENIFKELACSRAGCTNKGINTINFHFYVCPSSKPPKSNNITNNSQKIENEKNLKEININSKDNIINNNVSNEGNLHNNNSSNSESSSSCNNSSNSEFFGNMKKNIIQILHSNNCTEFIINDGNCNKLFVAL